MGELKMMIRVHMLTSGLENELTRFAFTFD